ncbi:MULTISPECIES: Wzz/FepE/Etk N-terminal domain-containing protein [Pseudomonas]|uniref:Chain-length determining protein n=1 Tax=Pseudomonas synxantha TaxID=47883 RepID=A0A5D3G3I2_9PSED|nr:Wzz/FepE/Etk N-terminal domain-containing protein [Pseudomonas synxantha]MCK3825979.1 chain-length determining protein [Pseudomonas sp. W2Aug9]MCK3831926.1 chain-length determining protein [Pseudomonas fluorescens]MCK3839333.1 chain-length determining protein [Pseudomonas sp. NCIMB 10586]MCK3845388.1 chain-length determining protein [Pseudomonas sp. W15Feb34]TYK54125.1 chain-length determining protein [Pseudomonas synxantha]
MSSSFRVPPAPSSGEIDLAQILRAAWLHKKLILATSIVFGLLAGFYAYSVVPEYEVSSVLRPAAINELDALNRSEIYQLPPSAALIRVGASLESYDTRLGFFRSNPKLFQAFERPGRTLEQSFEEFNRNSIRLILTDPRKIDTLSPFIGIEMTYPQGVDGVAIINGFVDYAIATERDQIAGDLNVIVKNRLSELKGKLEAARSSYQIGKEAKIAALRESDNLRRAQLQDELKALRAQLKALRGDRIAQLTEAIGIAKSLGIRKPTTPSSLGDSDRASLTGTMRTEINNQQIPLYFMGVEALEAERSALAQRRSDDFTDGRIAQIAKELQLLQANREAEVLGRRDNEDIFLGGVESLRAEEARLSALSIDISRLKLVTVDKRALEPLAPIRPKKTLIILAGLVLGLLLGLAVALGSYLFKAAGSDSRNRLRASTSLADAQLSIAGREK